MDHVDLRVADGTTMRGHIARPPDGRVNGPGILVFQETFGVNDYIRDIARRFADLGITAIAPELYHRTLKGPPIEYADIASARPHSAALTVASMALDIQAAYDWLKNEAQVDTDRVAAVGFCQGGRTAYIANAYLPLAGAISFYGGRMHDALDLVPKQHGPNLNGILGAASTRTFWPSTGAPSKTR